MFEAKSILYIYAEHPLHAGSGRGLGAIDLPIQRERGTGYPIVQGSGIKGCLRDSTKDMFTDPEEWLTIFGPETGNASDYAGSLSTGDARLLLFPVRSLAGVFAYTTSVDVLARFFREASLLGITLPWSLPSTTPAADKAWVDGQTLVAGSSVVLEDYGFDPDQSQAAFIASFAKWVADDVLPNRPEYAYFKKVLGVKVCVLPDEAFRDFTLYATEVRQHIKIKPDTKTVESGALWNAESLPVDSILYVPLLATPARNPKAPASLKTASQILNRATKLELPRVNLGGDETTGQGLVALRFGGVS